MEGRNGIVNTSYSDHISLAKFLLKSYSFQSVMFKDKEQEFYKIIKSDDEVSELMFPMVVQAIKTGSRADQIYLESSDVDYMYEVGPLIVGQKQNNKSPATDLYYNSTGNAGFYTVCDRKGGHVYPVAMQSKLAPMIREVKQIASLKETSAALPLETKTTFPGFLNIPKPHLEAKDEEDSVIALKCQEWPENIWENFKNRNVSPYFDMHKLKETHLFLVPKSHPKSLNPWIEWRLSFSLVEKEMYPNIPYVFRKVYLYCKTLTLEWKEECKFHSYVLKTVFLWTCEKKWQKKKLFTEDDILPMIVDVFEFLLKCYEERNVPMYFIPELNLLEEYSKTKKEKLLNHLQDQKKQEHLTKHKVEGDLFVQAEKKLISEVRKFTNMESLAKLICKRYRYPFAPVVQKWTGGLDRAVAIIAGINSGIGEKINMIGREQPSHENLYVLYNKKIHQSNGILEDEDKLELLCELYVTFLFLLHERLFGTKGHVVYDCFEHSLYFLKIFENTDVVVGDDGIIETYDIIDSPNDDIIVFIKNYSESIINFFNKYHPLERKRLSGTIDYCFPRLDENIKNLDKYKRFLNEITLKKLPENRPNENLDRLDDRYLSLIYGRNIGRYVGNSEQSQELQKLIVEEKFWQDDLKFKSLVDKLNTYLSTNFRNRFSHEINAAKKACEEHPKHQKSYLLKHLVYHMCDMYNYGFTKSIFDLPTPAVYISYLSQLLLNIKCSMKKKIEDEADHFKPHEEFLHSKFRQDIQKFIGSPLIETNNEEQWGFTVKAGDTYVDYEKCKGALIPFTFELVGDIANDMELSYVF